jgi:acetyl-CoA C-acetyltransferase
VPLDPRTPVLIGVGQLSQRVDRGEPALEPVDMIAEAARRAAADSGGRGGLLTGLDSVRIVRMLSWRYEDPGTLVAARVGAAPAQSMYSNAGGNTPQSLLNRTAGDIADGRADLVLLGGAEAWRTRMGFRADNGRPPWTTEAEGTTPAEPFGAELEMSHPAEAGRGLLLPVQMYPIFETAVRAAAGRSVDDHQQHLGRLWAGFSDVAAGNPNAWIRRRYSAEEIRTPGPDNRMIGFPYPKLMNSNNAVEQAAAVILCSAERADALGVPRDRWVFPLSGADAHDTPFVSNRPDLRSSPAIRAAGRAALASAGAGIDAVAHADLYSCFPSAVEVAAAELGLAADRPLTVTGGLSFAGGPWNNYVMHAIATMATVLRSDAGAVGLCSANGGFLTKHSIGLYSTTPPAGAAGAGFRDATAQAAADAEAPCALDADYTGACTVEGYVVMHDRDGEPQNSFAALRTPAGARAWGTTNDTAAMKAMTEEEHVGRAAERAPDGTFAL